MAIRALPLSAVAAFALGIVCACSSPSNDAGFSSNGGAAAGTTAAGASGSAGNAGQSGGGAGVGASVGAGGAAGTTNGGASSGGATAGNGGGGSAGSAGSACVAQPLSGASSAKMRTVVYLPTWRGSLAEWATKLDFAKVTHVNIAFADVNASGDLSLSDAGLCEFVNAAHDAGVKVCVAVGGATTIDDPGVFGTLMQSANRAGFVAKIDAFLDERGLDCFDVDLEGSGVTGDYDDFVAELASVLQAKDKELSAAIARWFDKPELTAALADFDFVNIMAYDLCKFWETTPCAHSSLSGATAELEYWTNDRALPASKAVLGVPFYGYRWQGGTGEAMTYSQIVGSYGDLAQEDWITSGDATIVHNSLGTIVDKAALAKNNGGIMIWEIGQDIEGQDSLLTAIDGAL